MRNYLWGHENPWQLAGPPTWWLQLLYAADPELVVFPSKTEGVYRVARRVPQNTQPIMTAVRGVPDTATYVTHRLIPITSLVPFTAWSPIVINDLMARNIERAGGWQAAARALDDFDDRKEAQARQATIDQAGSIAYDSWWSAQFRTGGAVSMAHTKRAAGERAKKSKAYRPLNVAGGSAVFVGRGDAPARTTGRTLKPFVDADSHVSERTGRSLIVTP